MKRKIDIYAIWIDINETSVMLLLQINFKGGFVVIGQNVEGISLNKDVMSVNSTTDIKITLEQREALIKGIKVGVFKALHKKNLLTDMQLTELIKKQK